MNGWNRDILDIFEKAYGDKPFDMSTTTRTEGNHKSWWIKLGILYGINNEFLKEQLDLIEKTNECIC